MKRNFFVKATAMCLAATMMVASFGACKKKKSGDKKDIAAAGSWDGKIIEENKIDKDAIKKGYTFKVSAYRDFSADPLNHEYADGAEKFMKDYPGAKVEYLTIGDHQPDQILAAIASGDVWDLQYVFTCSQLPGDIVDGVYAPIDGYFDIDDSRIDKNSLRSAYFDGHYYGVANELMHEMNWFSYNENMFKENGIKTPHEYYAEGKWNFDAFFEICTALNAKGLKINTGNFTRPDWILNKATSWNEDFTEVEIVLDSADTRQYLDKLKTIAYDYKMLVAGGSVAKREVALSSDVVPNLNKTNQGTETTDVIRYIYFPSTLPEEVGPHAYLTDTSFMTPAGSEETMKAATIELAIYMGESRKARLDELYKETMIPEDYDILMESVKNTAPLQRAFSPDFRYSSFKFYDQIMTGKPVATYIAEYKTQLETLADAYNEKVIAYREETGLSAEKN